METFLKNAKSALISSADTYSCIHVVIGNEACDLDSAISAISYAYFLDKIKSDEFTLIVPVLGIPKADFNLRTEIVYLLNKFKLVGSDNLTFRDEIDLAALYASSRLRLSLVDHHVLSSTDEEFADCVVEVIDHRPKEQCEMEGAKMTIESVGSCSTLVAEKLIACKKFKFNSVIAGLLHATILVDTICLNPEAKKTTDKDINVLTRLEDFMPKVERKQIFSEIQTAKMDITGLTNLEILRKDLKVVTSNSFVIAMSSVPVHLETFLHRSKIDSDLLKFLALQKADAAVILTVAPSTDDCIERQLAIYSTNPSLRDKIDRALRVDTPGPVLDLTPIRSVPSADFIAYRQGNIAASRKAILPIVKTVIST
ncbi:exopolyphosphatase PRUNE1-like [Tubulanus polymorphus]|uniref:exopolyphosphatase PRUNE1-like n=1 Tax=Tubulanus polymorphus TaxID=672921 RepID=UPI003DA68767